MRLELVGRWNTEPVVGEPGRDVGAAVVRPLPGGGMILELGPADGPPALRLNLSGAEALRLMSAVQAVVNGGDEEVLIVDG